MGFKLPIKELILFLALYFNHLTRSTILQTIERIDSISQLSTDDLIQNYEYNVENTFFHVELGNRYYYSSYCRDQAIAQVDCISLVLHHFVIAHEFVSRNKQSELVSFNYEGMLNDMGAIYLRLGRIKDADYIFNYLLFINPNHVNALGNLASVQKYLGNYTYSMELYDRVISLDSTNPSNYYNYGVLLNKLKDREKCQEMWDTAIRLDPLLHAAYANLASMSCGSSSSIEYFTRGIDACGKGKNLPGLWSLAFQKAGAIIPTIIKTTNESIATRKQLVYELQYIIRHVPSNMDLPLHDLVSCGALGYYAIYHGYEDVYIRSLMALSFWKLASSSLSFTAPHLLPSHDHNEANYHQQPASTRLKVGFLSSYWFHHSVGLLLRGVIKNIDRNLFDVYLLHIRMPEATWAVDYVTEDLILSDLTYIALTGPLYTIQQEISAIKLDILVFGEIGMDPTTYFLSFSRLALRSLVFWGHAVSSGVNTQLFHHMNNLIANEAEYDDHIALCQRYEGVCNTDSSPPHSYPKMNEGPDYFISSTLFETQGVFAQLEYSERLLLLDTMTTFFYRPATPLHLYEIPALFTRFISKFVSTRRTLLVSSDQLKSASLSHTQLRLQQHDNNTYTWELPSALEFISYLYETDPICKNPFRNYTRDGIMLNECDKMHRLSSLTSDWHVYAIPQTLYKLRPDFDVVIFDILIQDEDALIVVPAGDNQQNLETIINRWHAIGITSSSSSYIYDRIIMVRHMNEREFITLCAIADVVLDPWPVGGGRSSLEIFSTNTPIIVLYSPESTTSILQLTLAMYKVMDIGLHILSNSSHHCCIAEDIPSYVAMAVMIASNKHLNDDIRTLIAKNSYRLYEDMAVVVEWNHMLQYVARNPRPHIDAISYDELSHLQYDSDDPYFIEAVHRLDTSPLWLSSEVHHMIFAHAKPAIILHDHIIQHHIIPSHVEAVVYTDTFHVKGVDIKVVIYEGDDWIDTCIDSFHIHHQHLFLEAIVACIYVGRGVERSIWPTYSKVLIHRQESIMLQHVIEYDIKQGDDISQALRLIMSKDSFSESEIVYILDQFKTLNVLSGSSSWIAIRKNLAQRVATRYLQRYNLLHPPSSISAPPSQLPAITSTITIPTITLAITTCKRPHLFNSTITALIEAIGPLPNALITQVIIIDDSSSLDDRIWMMASYPSFTFIFKSPADRGHVSSMNHLYRIVNTKYLLYLEDDWLLRYHTADMPDIDRMGQSSYVDVGNDHPISVFYSVLLSALAVIGYEGQVTVPSSDNTSSNQVIISKHILDNNDIEAIHQVLFNEQSTRACAEGRHDCDLSTLGLGGWERFKHITMSPSNTSHIISYALHEFGIMPSPTISSRLHSFSDWPGFSLNPGLLDLDHVKHLLSDVQGWQGDYFRADQSHHSFEQMFSAILFSRGFHMAYLPILCFSHIGDNTSAYELMGQTRLWQEIKIAN